MSFRLACKAEDLDRNCEWLIILELDVLNVAGEAIERVMDVTKTLNSPVKSLMSKNVNGVGAEENFGDYFWRGSIRIWMRAWAIIYG